MVDDRQTNADWAGLLMLEDRLLVLRCRHGSQEAMSRIYLKYKDDLLTLARGLLGERAAAEDTVHDVFVRFAESARQFRLTGSLKGYLATCTANLARDRIRVKLRRAENCESETWPARPGKGPEELAVATEQRVRLKQALARLPYEQREAVLLHLKAEMTFGEIAKAQCVSLSTAHGRYRYGLDKLRSLLNSESGL
jgi:RNA polymerase sigma-70 factor, ECF subfamily